METDAAALRPGTCLEAEVCIVGAGPAGLVIADALAGRGLRVVLLESGGRRLDRRLQALSRGEVVGDGYGDLHTTRHRQLGGTVHLWNTQVRGRPGAKYVPLDPIDFEARPPLALPGWPFGPEELDPWYRRAQEVCGLGPFVYGAEAWSDAAHAPFALRGDLLESRVYQLGTADVFFEGAVERVARARAVDVVTHATACALVPGAAGDRVEEVCARRPRGGELRVRAGRVVLAAGAVENARLLLLAAAASPRAAFDPYGRVGRGFMEHPRDSALRLVPARSSLFREAAFYDVREAADGTVVMGRLALREEALRRHALPNASVTLMPVATALRRGRARSLLERVGLRAGAPPSAGAGWSRAGGAAHFDALQLLVNLEQLPSDENRVGLASSRDALGLPRAELHWRWRPSEQARLDRLHALLAAELEGSGLGTVGRTPHAPDPRAHHHAGTTRMSADPRGGVVDADGRVHGVENLYVAGASVLPTAGFANPTLTIVALALRLAARLGGPAA